MGDSLPAPDAGMARPRSSALAREAIRDEMERARQTFHELLRDATTAELRRPTDGTRWTNEQLLFHMLFGYLVVRALLILVHVFGRLPDRASVVFARLLDAGQAPFHLINYAGSCVGARVIPRTRMGSTLDRVISALERRLEREPEVGLYRGMHYPTSWDPFFARYMTLLDLYRYPTRHFDYHRQQLTLPEHD